MLVSFLGGLGLGQIAARDQVQGMPLYVASLPDIAGSTMAVVQKRDEVKDYLDVDALWWEPLTLPSCLH